MKTKICSIGEAMIEISNIKDSFYNQSFAGDTLNFCNYLDKKKLNAFFLSAIGKSEINQSLLKFVKSKKISTPSSLNFFKPSVPQIAYNSVPILTPAMWSLSFLAVSSAFSSELKSSATKILFFNFLTYWR